MIFKVTMLETDFDNLVEQVDTTRPVMVDGKEYYKDRAEFSDCTTEDTEQGKTKTCSFMLLQRESKATVPRPQAQAPSVTPPPRARQLPRGHLRAAVPWMTLAAPSAMEVRFP